MLKYMHSLWFLTFFPIWFATHLFVCDCQLTELYRHIIQITVYYQLSEKKFKLSLCIESNVVKSVQGIRGNMEIFWIVSLIDNRKFTMADSCLFHLIFVSLQVVYKDKAALFH